ncbi:MAG: hypothetical protein ABFR32_05240 [Bacteroidota bacterium]
MKVFTETQRFNQWWLIVLFTIIVVKITYDLFTEFFQIEMGTNTKSLISLIISLIILGMVLILIFSMKLKSRIDEKGIYYQFFPFHFKLKKVAWEELKRCYVRKYNPLLEYGGWGIRRIYRKGGLRGNGIAYNIKGNMGIQMEFNDGGKILLGTQLPEKVELILRNYQYKLEDNS